LRRNYDRLLKETLKDGFKWQEEDEEEVRNYCMFLRERRGYSHLKEEG
jgi:hypothetical protein